MNPAVHVLSLLPYSANVLAQELVGILLWHVSSSETCRLWCEAPIQS